MTARFSRAIGSGGVRRNMSLWPFTADSAWNRPIGAGATFEAATDPATADLIDEDFDPDLAMEQWSHPVYWATASDPLVTVTWVDEAEDFVYRIPASATPALPDIDVVGVDNTDSHMHVVQPDGQTLFEAWSFQYTSSTTADAGYVVETDLTSNGLLLGVRGYGGSALGGLIRLHEFESRYIPHAIACAHVDFNMLSPWVWPATREDHNGPERYVGNVPMGTLAAIPPAVNINSLGLGPDGLALARAMQDYGLYIVDSADTFVMAYIEPGGSSSQADDLWADLPAIRAQLRVVTNNLEATPYTPGAPRRARAPRLVLR